MVVTLERFKTVVFSVLGDFAENHTQSRPKTLTEFDLFLFDAGDSFHVSEDSRVFGEKTIVTVNISTAVAKSLLADINPEDPLSLELFELQIFWLIHHEIGHWVLGHNEFYRSFGWATHLGLTDVTPLQAARTGPLSFAHAAELTADMFAIDALINYLATVGDTDKADDSSRNCAVALLIMLSVSSLFYTGPKTAVSDLHPDWPQRYQNAVLCVFEYFASHEVETSDWLSDPRKLFLDFSDDVLRRVHGGSDERTLLPRCRAALETQNGLGDLRIILMILTGGTDTSPDAAAFSNIRALVHILSLYSLTKSPVYDMDLYLNAEAPDMPDTVRISYRLSTDMTREQSEETLRRLCRERNAELVDIQAAQGPAVEEVRLFLDIVVETAKSMPPDAIKGFFDYLQAGLKINAAIRKTDQKKH